MKARQVRNAKGFTLVELAIVLVIIGLIIAGVLKGRELIIASKATNIVTFAKSLQGAVEQFKYKQGKNPFAVPSSNDFFISLNSAGLITVGSNPTHKLGGSVEMMSITTALTGTATAGTAKGNAIIFRQIPANIAFMIDKEMDDGNATNGDVFITTATTSPAPPIAVSTETADSTVEVDVVYFIK